MVESKKHEKLFDRTERERGALDAWRVRNQEYLNYYLDFLRRIQNRRILHYELLFSVIGFGLLINIASQLILEILFNTPDNIEQTGYYFFYLVCIGVISIPFAIVFNNVMKKFDPSPRSLYIGMSLDECAKYRDEEKFTYILKFLEEEKLTDFRAFSKRFLNCFENWCYFLKEDNVVRISESSNYKIFDTEKIFPESSRKYDISSISLKNVKATFEIILRPHIIWSGEGGHSHVRIIDIDFKLDVMDHMDPNSDNFINEFYWRRLDEAFKSVAYCIERAFYPLIDEINTTKIRENMLNKKTNK